MQTIHNSFFFAKESRTTLERNALTSDKVFSDLPMPHPTCAAQKCSFTGMNEECICILPTVPCLQAINSASYVITRYNINVLLFI